jgi:predicted O-methyltransferase YrrM
MTEEVKKEESFETAAKLTKEIKKGNEQLDKVVLDKVVKEVVAKTKPEPNQEKITLIIDGRHQYVDLSPFAQYMAWQPVSKGYFATEAIYKLLASLASQLPKGSHVVDLGTYFGSSALACATNPDVKVTTVDLSAAIPEPASNRPTLLSLPNIEFINDDCTHKLDRYLTAKIINIDLHPHDGIQEKTIISGLERLKYKGVAILDDIRDFEGLKAYWDTIKLKKYDATGYGHHSGTGIVVFDPNVVDVDIKI